MPGAFIHHASGGGTLLGRIHRLERARHMHGCPRCGGEGLWVVRYEGAEALPLGLIDAPSHPAQGCPVCGRMRELRVCFISENAHGRPLAAP